MFQNKNVNNFTFVRAKNCDLKRGSHFKQQKKKCCCHHDCDKPTIFLANIRLKLNSNEDKSVADCNTFHV